MGDDNEITQIVRRKSESFMEEARKAMAQSGKVYNLEEEFRKTRQNRSIIVIVVTALTILALAGTAVLATSLIRKQTAAMPVDVNAFEDLNLRDLLDTAKRNEADIQQAKLDLSRIQADEKTALDGIDKDYTASVESIKARGLSPSEEKRRIGVALALAAGQKTSIQARYSTSIAAGQAKVKSIQDKIDSYDKRLSDQSKKQQEILDNQNKLNDLEKERLTKSYEAKLQDLRSAAARDAAAAKRQKDSLVQSLTERWNPQYSDPETLGLLSGFTNPADKAPQAWDDTLQKAGVIDKEGYGGISTSYSRTLSLSSRLRAIPYLNSVPPALARMEYEARLQFQTIVSSLGRSGEAIKARDKQIAELDARVKIAETALERYRWATSSYVLDNREGGYIIDPRNIQEILVAINPAVPAGEGSTAFVVRQGSASVGTLSFFLKDGQLRARLVDLAPGETLKAFDPIVVITSTSPTRSNP